MEAIDFVIYQVMNFFYQIKTAKKMNENKTKQNKTKQNKQF